MKRLFSVSLVCVLLFLFVNFSPAYGITPEQQRLLATKYQQLMIENDELRKQNEELSSLFDDLNQAHEYKFNAQKEMFTISEARRQYLIGYADELKQERDTYAQAYQKVADELNKTQLKLAKQKGTFNGVIYTLIAGGIVALAN